MDNKNSISDEQLSIIASLTDLENRVEELYGLVNKDNQDNNLTKRVEKLEKKISRLSKKFDGLQEINSYFEKNIPTSPARITSLGSLTSSSLSNGILFIGLVVILFFMMLK
tara:strand:+ start:76 stop:408 length:333 start_codon:yes stop_codon:yes gene_type:complete